MSEYHRDMVWTRRMRDEILKPSFYGRYSCDGRYVFIDKGRLATLLQKRYAVDTIVQGKEGAAICIEEKIVRWPKRDEPYTAFTLETRSCTVPGRETPGWMQYGKADYLLYCFANRDETTLRCYLIDFAALQKWFWGRYFIYPETITEQINHTECRVVPIDHVEAHVPCWHYVASRELTALEAEGYQ
jgi:hypothetical protein